MESKIQNIFYHLIEKIYKNRNYKALKSIKEWQKVNYFLLQI